LNLAPIYESNLNDLVFDCRQHDKTGINESVHNVSTNLQRNQLPNEINRNYFGIRHLDEQFGQEQDDFVWEEKKQRLGSKAEIQSI